MVKYSPGCGCCGGPGCTSLGCADLTSQPPSFAEFTMSNWTTAGGCGCHNLNGTWSTALTESADSSGYCKYEGFFELSSVTCSGGPWWLRVAILPLTSTTFTHEIGIGTLISGLWTYYQGFVLATSTTCNPSVGAFTYTSGFGAPCNPFTTPTLSSYAVTE